MKRILPSVLAVLFLLGFSGCGKVLNDENFVDFWVETYDKDYKYTEELAEDYGWSHVDRVRYLEELKGDDERATFVYEAVAEKNEDAAYLLEFELFPDRASERMAERLMLDLF